MGSEYQQQGFPPDGYHGAGHAMLRAARKVHTAEWASELSSGWVAFYSWLRAHFEAGAEHARRTEQARQKAHAERAAEQTRARREAHSRQATVVEQVTIVQQAALARKSAEPAQPTAPRDPGTGVPQTLDDVLQRLRTHHFAGNERALGGVLTRIALRTGADLRAPRPDQRANPAVVANVTAVLQVMGYTLQQVATAGLPQPAGLPSGGSAQPRWWNRGARPVPPSQGRWRRIVPGLFR